jgi:hypothetical protein
MERVPMDDWWQPIRDLASRYFTGPEEGIGWQQHLLELNLRYGLSGDSALSTFPKPELPPSWFIGDVTIVVPREWVLVFSLNPATDADTKFYTDRAWTEVTFWEFLAKWFTHEWWNPSFHGSLTSLVMKSLELPFDDRDSLLKFARTHEIFVELCPYASRTWSMAREVLADMLGKDAACRAEAEMASRMIQGGKPKLILVNGNPAVENFELVYGQHLSWNERRYFSGSSPQKRLWHMEGTVTFDEEQIPIVGFPFLRKPRTHNSSVEMDQLAQAIQALLV